MPSSVDTLAIARHQRELIFKPLKAHILGAPMTASLPAALTSTASATLDELPSGWYDLGLIDKEDAITWSQEMEKATVAAIGYRDPVRSDVTSKVTGLAYKALEMNRYNMERYLGFDLSGATPNATTGELVLDDPGNVPVLKHRYLAIAEDGVGADKIYVARALPSGEVSETGEQTWTDAEGSLAWPVTVNGMVDTTLGFSIRYFFGGPGWKALLADAGFGTLPPAPTALAAGTITATSVVLTWTAAAGAVSYQVQRSTDNGDTYTDVLSANGGAPTASPTTVTGLTASTAYRFRVAALGTGGVRGPYSSSIGVTTTA